MGLWSVCMDAGGRRGRAGGSAAAAAAARLGGVGHPAEPSREEVDGEEAVDALLRPGDDADERRVHLPAAVASVQRGARGSGLPAEGSGGARRSAMARLGPHGHLRPVPIIKNVEEADCTTFAAWKAPIDDE